MKMIDYVIIAVLVVLVIVVIMEIRRGKGGCAYCEHRDSCPFKKKAEELKKKKTGE